MSRIFICLIFLLVGFTTFAQAPKWAWVKGFSEKNYSNVKIIDACKDAVGNFYVVGYFEDDSLIFGNISIKKSSMAFSEMFVMKISPCGNPIWAKSSYTNATDYYRANGICIGVNSNGDVYVGGDFQSSYLNFNGITIHGTYPNSTNPDIFLVKYNKDGNEQWAKSFLGSGADQINRIRVDNLDNIFITGQSNSKNLLIGSDTLADSSNTFIFFSKISNNGSNIFSKKIVLTRGGDLEPSSLAIDGGNSIVVSGYLAYNNLSDSIIFDSSRFSTSSFIMKILPTNKTSWFCNFYGKNLAVNSTELDSDSLLFCGVFEGDTISVDTLKLVDTTYTTSFLKVFIGKLDNRGKLIWCKIIKHADGLGSLTVENNQVVMSGGFNQSKLIFGYDTLSNSFQLDKIFIAAFDKNNGNSLWGKMSKSEINDQAGAVRIIKGNSDDYFLVNNFGYHEPTNPFSNTYIDTFLLDTIRVITNGLQAHTSEPFIGIMSYLNNCSSASVNQISKNELFPNPFSNSSTLKINSSQTLANARLSVVDVLGREVQSINDIHSNTINIERKNLPSGIYFYRLTQNGNSICNGKMVVE